MGRLLDRRLYDSTQGGVPNSEAVQAALGEARAQFETPEHEVHFCVAGHDNRIYVDLCDPGWRAIEIDADGWRVVENPPVYFRGSNGMKPLPEPVAGGDLNDDLKPLLNAKSDDDFI